jgi:hypothetical protein
MGAKVKYAAYDAAKKYSAGWKYQTVDCNSLAPEYCNLAVSIPAGTWVNIDGIGWKQNGDSLQMPMGAKVKYAAYDAAKKYSAGWKYQTVDCNSLAPSYCAMSVELEKYVWDKVNIDGIGWVYDGDMLQMPISAKVKYNAYDVAGDSTGWRYKDIDCTPLKPICKVQIKLPDGTYVHINGVGWFVDGDWVEVKPTKSYKYLTANANKYVRSPWKYKVFGASNCGRAWDLTGEFCEMAVDIPTGAWVNINGVGWYQDGTKLWMPTGARIKYLAANANKYVRSPWAYHDIDCDPLAPSFCEMVVDIPTGTWVNINGVGWYQDGTKLWMPTGAKIKYLAANANKYVRSPWAYHDIDCDPLAPSFCAMEVELEKNVWKKVKINGVGWYQDGTVLQMPIGAAIKYLAEDVNGDRTGWQTKPIDCSDLLPACKVTVTLPPGVYLYIEHVGYFQDGEVAEVKPVKTHRYKLYDSTKKVSTDWKNKSFSASDCGKTWDLTGEFCNMSIDLDSSDGYVYIENVGYFQHGNTKWVPTGASFRYRAYDSTKKVMRNWRTHTVGCEALKPGFCNMGISLSDSYEWVYIENVGWFQDGDSDWMPSGASFRYKACDANKQNCTGWVNKSVDCNDLEYPPE